MASTAYYMSVRFVDGTYEERETLFNSMKDIVLGVGSSFDVTNSCDFHEINVYGVPDYEVVNDCQKRLLESMTAYRTRFSPNTAHRTLFSPNTASVSISAYPEKSDEATTADARSVMV